MRHKEQKRSKFIQDELKGFNSAQRHCTPRRRKEKREKNSLSFKVKKLREKNLGYRLLEKKPREN